MFTKKFIKKLYFQKKKIKKKIKIKKIYRFTKKIYKKIKKK